MRVRVVAGSAALPIQHPTLPWCAMSKKATKEWMERLSALDKLLKSLAASNVPRDNVANVQVAKLIAAASRICLCFDDLQLVMAILSSSCFSDAQRTDIEAAANATAGGPGDEGDRAKGQNFESLPYYPTKAWWVELGNYVGDPFIKISDLCVLLGLRNPSERTFVTMLSMSILARQNLNVALALPTPTKTSLLTAKKGVFRGRLPKEPLYGSERVHELPSSPEEFETLHPTIWNAVFADGERPLGKHPWGASLEALVSSIKCRRTPAAVENITMGADMMQIMQQYVSQMQQGNYGRRAVDTPITVYGEQQPSVPGWMLALTAPMQPPPAPAPETMATQASERMAAPAPAPIAIEDGHVGGRLKRLSVDDAARAVLQSMEDKKDYKKVEVASSSDDDESTEVETKKKKKKHKTSKAAKKNTTKAREKGKASVGNEKSRNQIMGRTGIPGPGSSKKFRYGKGEEFSNFEKARQAAELWAAKLNK